MCAACKRNATLKKKGEAPWIWLSQGALQILRGGEAPGAAPRSFLPFSPVSPLLLVTDG